MSAALAALARACGAEGIAHDALAESHTEPQRERLRRRLAHYLEAYRSALRDADLARDRVAAFERARDTAYRTIAARALASDGDREQLEDALALERTKFLMSSRADALAELFDRLAAIRDRRRLREMGMTATLAIATTALGRLQQRACLVVDRAANANAARLARDVQRTICDQVAAISLLSVVVVVRPLPITLRAELGEGRGLLARLADHVPLTNQRGRVEIAAAAALRQALEVESQVIVRRASSCYDTVTCSVEAAQARTLEQITESVRCAGSRADRVRAAGARALDAEHRRVDAWLAALADLPP